MREEILKFLSEELKFHEAGRERDLYEGCSSSEISFRNGIISQTKAIYLWLANKSEEPSITPETAPFPL